jgi:hypothetical protein
MLWSWGGASQVVGRLVSSFSVSQSGVLTETNWFTANLPDAGLAALAASDFTRDDAITRNDFVALLEAVASRGAVTADELQSLQALVNNSGLLNIPDYVENLAMKVVDGNPANANYQGQPLGNLGLGSSTTQVVELVGKWFYGTDVPAAPGLTYQLTSGTLFGTGGPQSSDVIQGELNDSYLLTTLGQLASSSPAAIEAMFINNGDGTYTVRFFNNGNTDYVTVNQCFPVLNLSGSELFYYANLDGSITGSSNILWVALAEKAYAQLAEEGWSRGVGATNAYSSLNGSIAGANVSNQIFPPLAPTNQQGFESVLAANLPSSGTGTASSVSSLNLPDAGVEILAQSDVARDGCLTRNDFVGLLEAVASRGPVTGAELASLQTLANTGSLWMNANLTTGNAGYAQNLAQSVVDGNSANLFYQGQPLGDLAVSSSTTQVLDLLQKWFYGTDLPTTESAVPGNNQTVSLANTGVGYPYEPAAGTLFSSSITPNAFGTLGAPSYNDVAQGEAPDCFFMSALGQLALQLPTTIESMFIDNGDGTYTVRFYNGGSPSYVTVNTEVPSNSDGTFAYAGYYQYGQPNQVSSNVNVLWVALAEKAYAQLAEEGWSRSDHSQNTNSYDSVAYGLSSTVMEQITGSSTGNTYSPGSVTLQQFLSDMKSQVICVGTPLNYNGNDQISFRTTEGMISVEQTLDANHLYMLDGYDSSNGLFTLVNPYDDGIGDRVVRLNWAQMQSYICDFDEITLPTS